MFKSIIRKLDGRRVITMGEAVNLLSSFGIPFELQGLNGGISRLYVGSNLVCSTLRTIEGSRITAWLTFNDSSSFDTNADLPLRGREATKQQFIKYCNEYLRRKLQKGAYHG